jgi:hypothetical protein
VQRRPLDLCIDLYGLWLRYETHSTLHSGQKARAEFALQCDCLDARYERGLEELRALLRRARVPFPVEG